MARVRAVVPDLLFGSSVLSMLQAAGHDAELVNGVDQLRPGADVVVLDLTAQARERLDELAQAQLGDARTLAFYSHVEADVRRAAQEAGIDLVVPRSRMAREGAELVARLLSATHQ